MTIQEFVEQTLKELKERLGPIEERLLKRVNGPRRNPEEYWKDRQSQRLLTKKIASLETLKK